MQSQKVQAQLVTCTGVITKLEDREAQNGTTYKYCEINSDATGKTQKFFVFGSKKYKNLFVDVDEGDPVQYRYSTGKKFLELLEIEKVTPKVEVIRPGKKPFKPKVTTVIPGDSPLLSALAKLRDVQILHEDIGKYLHSIIQSLEAEAQAKVIKNGT